MFKWLIKVAFVTIITLLVLIVIKNNSKFKNIVYDYVYNDNISFSYINSLYKKYFGTNTLLDDSLHTVAVFNEKLEYSTKERIDEGLKLTVSEEYLVPSLEEGLVIFTGTKENYGNVVIVQQVDGVDVWYGNLSNINVKLYDYIEKGSLIGNCDNTLYLIHKKDGEYLDYENKI